MTLIFALKTQIVIVIFVKILVLSVFRKNLSFVLHKEIANLEFLEIRCLALCTLKCKL